MKTITQLNPIGKRVSVPLNLAPITTIGEESDAISGKAKQAIWAGAQGLYRTGLHPGLSLVVRHRGEIVVNRAVGHRVLGEPTLMTTETPTCLYSGSKAITAVLIHVLIDEGVLALDEPVATYVPEFGANGKEAVTLRDLLTHRAGIKRLPLGDSPDVALLFDWDFMVGAICAAPLEAHTKQAYHAVTSGYVLGEAAKRATGESLPDLLRTRLAEPLDAPTLTYGVPAEQRDDVALSYSTGPEFLPPLTQIVNRLLGLPAHVIAPAVNTDEGMSSVVPAAGMYASAIDASKVYQMLLDGGQYEGNSVLSADIVAESRRPAGPIVIDGSIPVPLRFSAGFMLGERPGSMFGLNTPKAFGHLGFSNILCWADPDRHLSAALLTTGKAVSPEGFLGMLATSGAISAAIGKS